MREKLVYLMYNDRNGFIKIGHSSNPRAREITLQAEDPHTFILAMAPGGRKVESELHKFAGEVRIRGEWFRLVGSTLEYIFKNYDFRLAEGKGDYYSALVAALTYQEWLKRELIRQVLTKHEGLEIEDVMLVESAAEEMLFPEDYAG